MKDLSGKVVVVTGASAGIGRAAAEAFGRARARVALIARGVTGLEAAAKAVEEAGGTALVVPVDVSDYARLREAAVQIETELGQIDVWVNVAFASVFAPFRQISPDEYRRVTEVSYLGFVHGTMVALSCMTARNAGAIVQVGSALGERAIPLQSAYCGAKHAINGFTESLRCELLHDKSKIHVTVVQMPAVNTPQFSWVRSRLPNHPQPVPPIYQPEVAAKAIVHAAAHPERKQYWVGGTTTATLFAQKLMPALLDRYLARSGYSSQQTTEPPEERAGNLFSPLDGPGGRDFGSHGIFDDQAHQQSFEQWCSEHLAALSGGAAAAVTGAAGYLVLRSRAGRR